MKVGVNSFGVKFKLSQDFSGALQRLKAGGVTHLEPCIVFSRPDAAPDLRASEFLNAVEGGIWPEQDASARIAQVRAEGLEVAGAHVFAGEGDLLELLPQMIALAKENGLQYYVISLNKNVESIKPLLPMLEAAAVKLAEEGIVFCYHNHQTEAMPENDTTAMALVLEECPHMQMQIDVGWAQYGGTDPVAFIKAHSERIPVLHMKDMHPCTGDVLAQPPIEQFTVVGEGFLDLKAIMQAAKACPLLDCGVVIDQDDSVGDILDDVIKGAAYVKEALN